MPDYYPLEMACRDLNAATSRINESLKIAEGIILTLEPGVTTWVLGTDDPTVKYGYARFSDGWHLAVMPKGEPPKAILHASREHRVLCLTHLDKIVVELTVAVRKMTEVMKGESWR